METSDSMAWECKLFTHELLGFRSTENREMKLHINTSYMDVTTSSFSEKIPHRNIIQDSSRLKPKSWKLVIQWHGNACFSHMSFLGFDPQRIWKLN